MSKRENGTQCIYWRVYGTLMSDIPSASGLILPFMVSQARPMNWCGITKSSISALLAASSRSGTATCERERERGENERGIERRICLILNDETWRNMHALSIFTIWLVTPTVRCSVLWWTCWLSLGPHQAKTTLFTNKSFWLLYRVSVASANGFLGL